MGARKLTAVEPLSIDGTPIAAGESFSTTAERARMLMDVGAAVKGGSPVPEPRAGVGWRVRGAGMERVRLAGDAAPEAGSIEPASGDRAAELKALASAAGLKGSQHTAPAPAATPTAAPAPVGSDRVSRLQALARRAGIKGAGRADPAERSQPTGKAAQLLALARRAGLPGFDR